MCNKQYLRIMGNFAWTFSALSVFCIIKKHKQNILEKYIKY